MKRKITPFGALKSTLGVVAFFAISSINAQTNVFDDVIATSPDHNYLEAALVQEGLDVALQTSPELTVFAPTDQAFIDIATALGTDINGLLELPNLSDILTYHVLGAVVPSSAVTNGLIAEPLSTTNTLKLTVTGNGEVYVNQAKVSAVDLTTDNGVVHVIDGVVLPNETVVDVAIDNGFNSLATAVITAELMPILTDPLGTFTVFAPTDDAFTNLATALGTDINGLLALPNLADILTYHVLGSLVASTDVTNGAIVNPVSSTNSLKLTVTGNGGVFVNQAAVTAVDITSDNGIVHVLDGVVLPNETVVDVAIDNGFNALASAVIASELMPLLTNPLATYTVFAPTDQAFQNLADLVGVPLSALFDPAVIPTASLQAVLGTHVLGAIVPSADVTNGAIVDNIVGINTLKLTVKGSGDVFVNQAQVTAVDVNSDNGVVHVINSVLLPDETVVDVAIDNGFSSLATAVITAELMPALTDPYNLFTVFAPTNDAFDNLAAALGTDINGLLALPNLADILLYHVVGGAVLSTDLTNGNVPTLNGADITVDLSSGVMINDAMVTTADVEADNGVVHIIDKVLLPGAGISEESIEISIYPNPATEKLFIESSADVDFYITDLSGSVVKRGTTGMSEISISNLKSGAYLIHTSGSQNGQVYRFIKQ